MATLTTQQLKDSYQSLVTIGDSITSDPTSGQLENGKGTPLTAVGINTNSPAKALHIYDSAINKTAQLKLSDGSSDTSAYIGSFANTMWLTNGGTYAGSWSLDGAYGIGVIEIGSIDGGSLIRLNTASSNTTSTERMKIHSSGDISFRDGSANEAFYWDASTARLGLGTTTPTLSLDVRGTQGSPASSGTSQVGSLSIRGTGSHFISSGMLNVSPWTGWFQSQNANDLSINYPLALNPNGGNVGIGTTSPVKKLQVTNGVSGDAGNLLLVNTNDTNGDTVSLQFSMTDTDSFNKAGIFFERTTTQGRGSLHFANNIENNSNNVTKNDARLTIDSSGNVLVGKTDTSSAVVGTTLWSGGFLNSTVDGDYVARFNRNTSDGEIIQIYKDNTPVGSIASRGGTTTAFITNPSSGNGAGLTGSTNMLIPSSETGVAVDNRINLGSSGARFKDLYLSGSVGIGGTSIGAKLDIQGTDTEPLIELNNTVYTFAANVTTSQSNTHTVTIPFTSQGSQHSNFLVEIYASAGWSSATNVFAGRALYTFNTLSSITNITELEDNGQNLSFAGTASGMNFIITITTTASVGQEPNKIGVMAKVIRGNGSVGNEPTSMTIA